MMGGLHIEMEQLRVLGTLLDGSGWTHVLSKSGLCGSGAADSFLKATHVKRSRYAHQVTVCCLYIFLLDKYKAESDDVKLLQSFDDV